MGGFNPTKDQNLVDYSGEAAKPAGAAASLPVGRVDTKGNAILTPAQRAEDEAASKLEKPSADSPNAYGRDAKAQNLKAEDAIEQGLRDAEKQK